MTREELEDLVDAYGLAEADYVWDQSESGSKSLLKQSKAAVDPARAALIAGIDAAIAEAVERERESCAAVCEAQAIDFLSPEYATGQPMSSLNERFACEECARAIRARKEQP